MAGEEETKASEPPGLSRRSSGPDQRASPLARSAFPAPLTDSLLAQQKELEKQIKASQQKQAAETAKGLLAKAQSTAIIENLGAVDGDFLQGVADALKGQFKGVVVLGGSANGAVALVASVSPDFTAKFQAGKIIQAIAPIVGGKGGGKPDNARGGGKDVAKLDEALAKARELVG